MKFQEWHFENGLLTDEQLGRWEQIILWNWFLWVWGEGFLDSVERLLMFRLHMRHFRAWEFSNLALRSFVLVVEQESDGHFVNEVLAVVIEL